jgi:TonB family protein
MLEQKPRPDADTTGDRAAYKQRRKLFLATVLLLVALIAVLVKDHQFWFGADETPTGDETSVDSSPKAATQTSSTQANPASQANKHAAAKGSTASVAAGSTVIATDRVTLPPLDVEVVVGDKHHAVHPGSNSVTIVMPPDTRSGAAVTSAGERVQMSPDTADALQRDIDSSYPSLAPQMKVQGAVVLQAHIGADGIIQEMRVISGPPILVSAAREAVRQWQFKPYLQNGQPVETQAKIIVNFTIKVLDKAT